MPKNFISIQQDQKEKIKGPAEPQNKQHNVKKEALGPNTRRK